MFGMHRGSQTIFLSKGRNASVMALKLIKPQKAVFFVSFILEIYKVVIGGRNYESTMFYL
jgi:hypothetical protein